MFDYRQNPRHAQSVLGYSYSSQPVTASSGIMRFGSKLRADHALGADYASFGNIIVDSEAWLGSAPKTDCTLVMREPWNVSNSSLMSPTAAATVFGAGCQGLLANSPDFYVVLGNSPEWYLDEMLSLGYLLLWDGHGKRRSVFGYDDIRYRANARGRVLSATYLGEVPECILTALAFTLDSEISSMLSESLTSLVRLLEYGKTGEWGPVDSVPQCSIHEMTLGYFDDSEVSSIPGHMAADDPIGAYALKYAAPELLESNPISSDAVKRFASASAFGQIWEGMLRNADKRGRAGHLHDLLATRLEKDGIEDKPSPEWLSEAIDVIGHALGIDYAFEAYLSGAEVEHIIDSD